MFLPIPSPRAAAVFLALGLAAASPAARAQSADDGVELPPRINDPFEPTNRLIWGVNKAFTNGVLYPLGKVWQGITTPKGRQAVSNFGDNIDYPQNAINHTLQGEKQRAGDETRRFGTNTIEGVLGIYDPATKKKNIPNIDADFGQTLHKWGWGEPKTYLMLPGYGPSNGRDLLGLLGNAATRPANYFPPYGAIHYVFSFNDYSEHADDYRRLTKTNADSYDFVKKSWSYVRRNEVEEFSLAGEKNRVPLETVQAIFFDVQDPSFPNRSRTRAAGMPATGGRLKFTYWLRPEPAPVVYIVPGLGAHRLDRSSLALAELLYDRGFSPVSVSSVFHPEFIENGSTTGLPAYPPVDTRDLLVALTAIDGKLESMHPGRLGARGLLGYSMGGFHALTIGAGEKYADPSLVGFDRIVAINTPVSLLHGMDELDRYFRTPNKWPEAERTGRIDHTFRKVAALTQERPDPAKGLPFDADEAKFLIGYVYRTTLRDVIFTSQRRENLGVLEEPIKPLRRSAAYDEIMDYSYDDYLHRFAVPYYRTHDVALASESLLERSTDLRSYAAGLSANRNIHLVMTRNDFLLAPGDLAWLRTVVPAGRTRVFEKGGHMGNLREREVQEAILDRFAGLSPLPR